MTVCSLGNRRSYSRNAIETPDELRVGNNYYALWSGIIVKFRPSNFTWDDFDTSPDGMKVVQTMYFCEITRHQQERHACDMGLCAYHNADKWNSSNMVFHTLEDAMYTGQHRHYPRRIPYRNMIKHVEDIVVASSVLPLTINPNIEG